MWAWSADLPSALAPHWRVRVRSSAHNKLCTAYIPCTAAQIREFWKDNNESFSPKVTAVVKVTGDRQHMQWILFILATIIWGIIMGLKPQGFYYVYANAVYI